MRQPATESVSCRRYHENLYIGDMSLNEKKFFFCGCRGPTKESLEKAYDTAWKYGILKDLHDSGLKGYLPTFFFQLPSK